jgi:PAS domain S-box-containing protein
MAGLQTKQCPPEPGASRRPLSGRAGAIIWVLAACTSPALASAADGGAGTGPLVAAVAGAAIGVGGIVWGLRMRARGLRRDRESQVASEAEDEAQRRQRARELTQRERLAEVMECTTDFVGALDGDLRLRWVNKAGAERVGLGGRGAEGVSFVELMPAWACERLRREAIPEALERGTWSGESALLAPGGREVPVSIVLLAHCDDAASRAGEGRVEGAEAGHGPLISIVARDISVHKQTEHSLLESRQRLELIAAIATQINAGTEPRRVVNQVVEQLARVFPGYRVRFCTVTGGGVLNVDYSLEPTAREGPRLPALQGMAADLSAAPEYLARIRTREPVAVSDAMRDGRLAALRTFLETGAIGATLSRALAIEGVEGLLAFDALSPHDWTEHETAALSETCDYLALAVSGARGVQERLNAEERLRRSEERLATIIENMPALAFAINTLGRIVFWNNEAQRVTGYSAKEIVGDPQGLEKLLPDPAYRAAVMTAWGVGTARAAGTTPGEAGAATAARDLELTVRGKDGVEHVLSWSSIAHRLPIPGWQTWGIATDVTHRRRAEASLRLSEERYRLLFESSPQPMWVYDNTSTAFLAVNEAAVREYGYSREEFLAMRITDIRPAEDVARLLDVLKGDREGPVYGSGPWRHRKRNGEIIEVEVSSHSVPFIARDARLVIVSDVTERNRYLHALRESRALLEQAQAVGHVGSWLSDLEREGKLVWSRESCRIFGAPDDRDTFVTTVADFFARVHPADAEAVRAAAEAAVAGGPAYSIDHRIVRADGAVRWVHEQAVIERDRSGRPLRMVGVVQDITERKLGEEQMARHAHELARSNAELERFAYVASHDLQEPLRMVTSFTQLLAQRYKDKLDKDANEFIGFAVEGATRMQRLIEDLLAYSRVGSANRKPGRVHSVSALRRATANLRTAIQESHARIEAGDLPEVTADEGQLSMVFQNLIGNAIKFRAGTEPTIRVNASKENGFWRFEVKDNGIGIDPKHRERIFTMFHRLHPRAVYPGNGIGLAICKRILEGHGGRIWVESNPGEGSSFYFTIPEEQKR